MAFEHHDQQPWCSLDPISAELGGGHCGWTLGEKPSTHVSEHILWFHQRCTTAVWPILAMKVEIIIMKILLKWKLAKADFPDFGAEKILMMLDGGGKVQLIGVLVLVFSRPIHIFWHFFHNRTIIFESFVWKMSPWQTLCFHTSLICVIFRDFKVTEVLHLILDNRKRHGEGFFLFSNARFCKAWKLAYYSLPQMSFLFGE